MPEVEPIWKQPRAPKARKRLTRGGIRFRRAINGEKSAAWHRSRQWCFDRAKGRCEARADVDCTGRAEHAHHIHLRSQGGSDGVENLLATCHRCHGYIHNHPEESYARGWIVRRATA